MKHMIVWLLIACVAPTAFAQVVEPATFYADSAHFAVPYAMDALFINTYDQPLRYAGLSCPNASDGTIDFVVADNGMKFSDTTIAAGDSIALRCVLISFSSQVSHVCGMNFRTDAGVYIQRGQVGVGGVITKFWQMTSSRENIVYGYVEVGSSKVDSVVLVNTGNGVAHLGCGIRNFEFRLEQDEIIVVNPGDSVTLHVAYEPTKVGATSDVVLYGSPYESSLPTAFLACMLSGNGVPRAKGLTPLEQTIYLGGYLFEIPDVDTSRYVCSQVTEVVSARLIHGVHFSIEHVSLPTTITPPTEFNVVVTLLQNSLGILRDTLLVTTADNEISRVVIIGNVQPTDVRDDIDPQCRVHPNPSDEIVRWCGFANEEWVIVNAIGETVATLHSDQSGNGVWSGNQPGAYTLVSRRTGSAMPFVLLK